MLVYKQIQLYKHVLIVLKYIIKCLGFSADKNRQLNTLYYMTLIKKIKVEEQDKTIGLLH